MTISPNYSPRWSENLNTLFFGIHRNERKEKEDAATVDEQSENDSLSMGGRSGHKKITDTYPEQKEFTLSPGSKLFPFLSDQGDTLLAALFLPAGYEEGKQYPTVVYIYERLTQGLNSYSRPSFPGGGYGLRRGCHCWR